MADIKLTKFHIKVNGRLIRITPDFPLTTAPGTHSYQWLLVHKGQRLGLNFKYNFSVDMDAGAVKGHIDCDIDTEVYCKKRPRNWKFAECAAVGYEVEASRSNTDNRANNRQASVDKLVGKLKQIYGKM